MVKQQNSFPPPAKICFLRAYGLESYLKDPERRRARKRESYMKDLEKSRADSAARSRES